jgi:hypothetical protein
LKQQLEEEYSIIHAEGVAAVEQGSSVYISVFILWIAASIFRT